MMEKNPNKSISSLARDMEVPEFLTRLLEHENIPYFSFYMRKRQFLSHTIE